MFFNDLPFIPSLVRRGKNVVVLFMNFFVPLDKGDNRGYKISR
jgi:hypothetical protein